MSEPLNVDPGMLLAAGRLADEHSVTVFAVHSSADQAIDSALFGWVGASGAALAAKAAAWSQTTGTLTASLYEHAEALRVSALSFAEMDRRAAAALADPAASPGE